MNRSIFSNTTRTFALGCALALTVLTATTQYAMIGSAVTVTVKKVAPTGGSKATGSRLFNDYQPLEVTVANNSSQPVELKSVNMPLADPKQVAKKYKFNATLGIVIGIFIPIITWPILGFVWAGKNSRVKREFSRRATNLATPLHIPANGVVTKLVYVRRENLQSKAVLTLNVQGEEQQTAIAI